MYLNSGLSSSRNHYGQRVITREADLVTAHEFGHNWGSEHDPDIAECSPSASQGGSFLMYTYSVSGYDVNNKVSIEESWLRVSIATYAFYLLSRNSLHVHCEPSGKSSKQNQAVASPSLRSHSVGIYASKVTNNAMLVSWEQKIMTHVAIKIVNYDEIKELFVVTRIRLAAKTVSTCLQE